MEAVSFSFFSFKKGKDTSEQQETAPEIHQD
jgi:hypothetical protein